MGEPMTRDDWCKVFGSIADAAHARFNQLSGYPEAEHALTISMVASAAAYALTPPEPTKEPA